MDPKELEFPQEARAKRARAKANAWYPREQRLVSREEILYNPRNLLGHVLGEPPLRQGWVSDGQEHTMTRTAWLCTALALCLNLNLMSGP